MADGEKNNQTEELSDKIDDLDILEKALGGIRISQEDKKKLADTIAKIAGDMGLLEKPLGEEEDERQAQDALKQFGTDKPEDQPAPSEDEEETQEDESPEDSPEDEEPEKNKEDSSPEGQGQDSGETGTPSPEQSPQEEEDAGDEPAGEAGSPKSTGKPKQKQKPRPKPGTADNQGEQKNPDEEESPEDQEGGEDGENGDIERWDNGPFGSKGMKMGLNKKPPTESEKTEGDGTQGKKKEDEDEKNLPQSVQERQVKIKGVMNRLRAFQKRRSQITKLETQRKEKNQKYDEDLGPLEKKRGRLKRLVKWLNRAYWVLTAFSCCIFIPPIALGAGSALEWVITTKKRFKDKLETVEKEMKSLEEKRKKDLEKIDKKINDLQKGLVTEEQQNQEE